MGQSWPPLPFHRRRRLRRGPQLEPAPLAPYWFIGDILFRSGQKRGPWPPEDRSPLGQ